jgi:hypothetical protein
VLRLSVCLLYVVCLFVASQEYGGSPRNDASLIVSFVVTIGACSSLPPAQYVPEDDVKVPNFEDRDDFLQDNIEKVLALTLVLVLALT